VQRGHDVTAYALACFGGAGAQHACQVAEALGMRRVLIHPLASLLSAYGIGLADAVVMRQRTAEVALDDAALAGLDAGFVELEREARAQLESQGFAPPAIEQRRELLLKYEGTDSTLALVCRPGATASALREEFLAQYRRRYGFHVPGRALIVDALTVTATGRSESPAPATSVAAPRMGKLLPRSTRPVYFDGAWCDTPFHAREDLRPGDVLDGPAVIVEPNTTVVVERDWRASLNAAGYLLSRSSTTCSWPSPSRWA
jgi:5-oxoprolinase (ATP-hydrolysing)